MKSPPEGLDGHELRAALSTEWGFDADAAQYLPEGFGSYHWVVEDAAFERRFVTVDDLDAKPWLGADRESTFAKLKAAFDTAHALRERGGLDFVISPLPTERGETLGRISEQYSVALFPMVDGSAGQFGEHGETEAVTELVAMLVELHAATGVVDSVATRVEPEIVGRGELEEALTALDRPWTGGPFAEAARASLAVDPERIARLLRAFDGLAAEVAASRGELVITHGEPHSGNVMRAADGALLVDWDTVGLAAPERDLWLVDDGSGDALELYAEASGRPVRQSAIDLYGLGWDLNDIAGYSSLLRAPHVANEDTEASARFLGEYVRLLDRWDSLV